VLLGIESFSVALALLDSLLRPFNRVKLPCDSPH